MQHASLGGVTCEYTIDPYWG